MRGLFGKLLLVQFGSLLLLGLAILVLFARANLALEGEATQRLHRDLAAQVLHDNPLLPANLADTAAVANAFHMMMVLGPNLELYVLDAEGRVRNYAAPPEKIKRQQVDLAPVRHFVDGTGNLPLLGDDPRSGSGRKPFSVAPILRDGALVGYLYIIIGSQVHDNISSAVRENSLLKIALGPLLIVLAVSLLISVALFYYIARPLGRLTGYMDRFQLAVGEPAGDSASAAPLPRDEIARLQVTFDRLRQRLLDQYEKLRGHKEAQRLLFNQMAHDLRAPLTNASVAVESAEGQLAQSQVETASHSLVVARHNLQRLKQRLTDMLQLARLDAGQIELVRELYPLPELVWDCVQDFACIAETRRVQIRVQAADDLPPVWVDIAQMSRVLNNLLDNAVRCTPEGAAVTVALHMAAGNLRVQISNPGESLPGEVKETLARGDRYPVASGTGLGLAICQGILALHGASLRLLETEAGNQLYFDLPVPGQGSTVAQSGADIGAAIG